MLPLDSRLQDAAARLPYAPLFVTVSGAHLYGFASPDSDFDLRGAHILPLRELVWSRRDARNRRSF
ncbi:DNA polymerase beta superfamily protein [Abditibacterium utsteinense]|uniref:DNA polymerase beta superfamily protein n=1 Tax=Abditibacterium utsteinense TaxID=1960156 RepID=UPI00237878D6|nr:nucleotidyltransferase domain-containing protein [Abditibacterium utsteinense]